jgi:hypothetical protein
MTIDGVAPSIRQYVVGVERLTRRKFGRNLPLH